MFLSRGCIPPQYLTVSLSHGHLRSLSPFPCTVPYCTLTPTFPHPRRVPRGSVEAHIVTPPAPSRLSSIHSIVPTLYYHCHYLYIVLFTPLQYYYFTLVPQYIVSHSLCPTSPSFVILTSSPPRASFPFPSVRFPTLLLPHVAQYLYLHPRSRGSSDFALWIPS